MPFKIDPPKARMPPANKPPKPEKKWLNRKGATKYLDEDRIIFAVFEKDYGM